MKMKMNKTISNLKILEHLCLITRVFFLFSTQFTLNIDGGDMATYTQLNSMSSLKSKKWGKKIKADNLYHAISLQHNKFYHIFHNC